MLSIVIPTLNEEDYLPDLLNSIKEQPLNGYEMIVSDSGSGDKTVEISERENCKVVFGKGELPAQGKNRGAKVARGDLLLFVDADIVLPENFLRNILKEFNQRNLDVASFYLKSKNNFHSLLFSLFYNFPARITQSFLPQAMNIILVKQKLHQRIGGFDEEIRLGEELDYVRKGKKIAKFGILNSNKIFTSSRRFQQDGWFKTWLKYFLCQIHMILFGPVKSDIFKYRFNHYSKKRKESII